MSQSLYLLVVMLGWIPSLGLGSLLFLKKETFPGRTLLGVTFLVLGSCWFFAALQAPAGLDTARVTRCRSNLKMIGLGLMMYKDDWNGQIPSTLDQVPHYVGKNVLLYCPADGRETNLRNAYSYRPTNSTNSHEMVCWDSLPHKVHNRFLPFLTTNLRNVLFADWHVEPLTELDFQKLYAKQAGQK